MLKHVISVNPFSLEYFKWHKNITHFLRTKSTKGLNIF